VRRVPAIGVLVAGGVALSLTLLAPAALALRSVRHLSTVDLGFEPERVFTAGLLMRADTYREPGNRAAFNDRLARALAEIPGVEAAGLSVQFPFRGPVELRAVESENGSGAPARTLVVDGGWFGAMGLAPVQGRVFEARDAEGPEGVVVVSLDFARRHWGEQDATGRLIRLSPGGMAAEPGPWHRVVGVVPSIRTSIEDAGDAELYLPLARNTSLWLNVGLRVRDASANPLADLERAVRSVDPTVAVSEPAWLVSSVAGVARTSRFLAAFLAAFAAFATVVAVVGLYAVLSFTASARRREVAIRMALGARKEEVIGGFLRDGLMLAAAGLAAGLGGAFLLNRAVAGQLQGVGVLDPESYFAGSVVVMVVAVLAAWFPARRASNADPMMILREE
jgi:predicted permease